jgi:hypothetical protein
MNKRITLDLSLWIVAVRYGKGEVVAIHTMNACNLGGVKI